MLRVKHLAANAILPAKPEATPVLEETIHCLLSLPVGVVVSWELEDEAHSVALRSKFPFYAHYWYS